MICSKSYLSTIWRDRSASDVPFVALLERLLNIAVELSRQGRRAFEAISRVEHEDIISASDNPAHVLLATRLVRSQIPILAARIAFDSKCISREKELIYIGLTVNQRSVRVIYSHLPPTIGSICNDEVAIRQEGE